MPSTSDKSPANASVRFLRKIYNPLGFSKGYNAFLFFIFDGALFGFILARFQYLNFNGVFCSPSSANRNHASPGECYWYTSEKRYYVGIMLHLATILPAGILAVFQFIPVIRHKVRLYHRIAGYVAITLVLISHAGAMIIADRAFGGDAAVRLLIGTLVILSTIALFLAWWNIKKLQIDQHRAWMLRAWFYLASIITLRVIMIIAATIGAAWPSQQHHIAKYCPELIQIYAGNSAPVYAKYPACDPNNSGYTDGWVTVLGDFGGWAPEQIGASFNSYFGMSGWLALALHAIGVELYLALTPREHERLRQVSYERQMERGMKDAGSAGLTADRLGDSERWVLQKREEQK